MKEIAWWPQRIGVMITENVLPSLSQMLPGALMSILRINGSRGNFRWTGSIRIQVRNLDDKKITVEAFGNTNKVFSDILSMGDSVDREIRNGDEVTVEFNSFAMLLTITFFEHDVRDTDKRSVAHNEELALNGAATVDNQKLNSASLVTINAEKPYEALSLEKSQIIFHSSRISVVANDGNSRYDVSVSFTNQ